MPENWKKQWNMKVTIRPIVIGTFGTVTKGLLKGLEDLEVGGRVETIQTTALLKTARILRRVLETRGDLPSLKLQWKTISLSWCEKLKWETILIIIIIIDFWKLEETCCHSDSSGTPSANAGVKNSQMSKIIIIIIIFRRKRRRNVLLFRATNWRNLTRKDVAMKGKP